MTSIRDLAREFGTQVDEMATFAGLSWPYSPDAPLPANDAAFIRKSVKEQRKIMDGQK